MNTIFENKSVRIVTVVTIAILALFLFAQTIQAFKEIGYVGSAPVTSAITVTGHGEVSLAPDLATVSFSVEKTSKTVAEANEQATTEINKIIAAVKALNIADKDIQTSNYNIYPKYDYIQAACSINYCPPGKSTLVGYTVSNSVTVKIRNLDNAGTVLTALAQNGATNVSGLNFGFDNEDKPKDEARAKAIAQAQEKAETLSRQLGVRLVAITGFSESGGNYPLMYAKTMNAMGGMDARAESAPVPVEVGHNTVGSDVVITYKIQ